MEVGYMTTDVKNRRIRTVGKDKDLDRNKDFFHGLASMYYL